MRAQADRTLNVADEHTNHEFVLTEFIQRELDESDGVIEAVKRDISEPFGRVLSIVESGIRHGGKLFLFGNGGSAAHAQHLASELVVRYKVDRQAIPAIALTADSTLLTACSNDIGFDDIFARQIIALARANDIALGISTSGRSPNVIRGLREARLQGLQTIGFTGGDGGELLNLCDACFLVPSKVTARIQEMHILIGHMLCKALEHRLGLV